MAVQDGNGIKIGARQPLVRYDLYIGKMGLSQNLGWAMEIGIHPLFLPYAPPSSPLTAYYIQKKVEEAAGRYDYYRANTCTTVEACTIEVDTFACKLQHLKQSYKFEMA